MSAAETPNRDDPPPSETARLLPPSSSVESYDSATSGGERAGVTSQTSTSPQPIPALPSNATTRTGRSPSWNQPGFGSTTRVDPRLRIGDFESYQALQASGALTPIGAGSRHASAKYLPTDVPGLVGGADILVTYPETEQPGGVNAAAASAAEGEAIGLARPVDREVQQLGEDARDDVSDIFSEASYSGVDVNNVAVAPTFTPVPKKKHNLLGQWRATSIAGNDISSSVLYTAGICAVSAGVYAPISLSLVVVVLYVFRNIYSEVCTAIPLNGGSYNALLNTTSKRIAALTACLTLISYAATAVVSASSASAYVNSIYPIWVTPCTIGLLLFFALLSLIGIGESSSVALVIFVMHLACLFSLLFVCIFRTIMHPHILLANIWRLPPKTILVDIFYGYATALLGVSGFESSSNYIEEQKPGVFPKTLRNMWIVVSILNPGLSFFIMGVLPIEEIQASYDHLLNEAAVVAIHRYYGIVVSVDAALVLAGSVLTAYVGTIGLMQQLALDRCLPQAFLWTLPLRHTNYLIIIWFFLLTTALVLVVPNVQILAGVYSIAFLSVMFLFAVGNILLKYKRAKMKRAIRSSWFGVLFGAGAIATGVVGNVAYNPNQVFYFGIFYAFTVVIVVLLIERSKIAKFVLHFIDKNRHLKKFASKILLRWMLEWHDAPMIFFTRKGDLQTINKAIMYVRENETTNIMYIVHCAGEAPSPAVAPEPPTSAGELSLDVEDLKETVSGKENESQEELLHSSSRSLNNNSPALTTGEMPVTMTQISCINPVASIEEMEENVRVLDKVYPKMKLELVIVDAPFTPETVEYLGTFFKVAPNFMFIACPGKRFPAEIQEYGGVRVITA